MRPGWPLSVALERTDREPERTDRERRVLIQRCQWHKRENDVSYLPRWEQVHWRGHLHHHPSGPLATAAPRSVIRVPCAEEERPPLAGSDVEPGAEEPERERGAAEDVTTQPHARDPRPATSPGCDRGDLFVEAQNVRKVSEDVRLKKDFRAQRSVIPP